MFTETARYYDKIYAGKDYAGESERLLNLVAQELGTRGVLCSMSPAGRVSIWNT